MLYSQEKKNHKMISSSGQDRLNYLEIQLAAVASAEKKVEYEKIVASVGSHGQKLMYDTRGVGSLVTGDIKKISKFKTAFSCLRCQRMFCYHLFGFTGLSIPFAIQRWGYKFTRVMGLAPCYSVREGSRCCPCPGWSAGCVAHTSTPFLIIAILLQQIKFSYFWTNSRFFLVNFVPVFMLFFAWFCRLLTIAIKYAFLSKHEFESVVNNIDTPRHLQEWINWHLFAWAKLPDAVLDHEISLSAIRRGTSELSNAYNFRWRDNYANVEEAKSHARAINKALGYVCTQAGAKGTYATKPHHFSDVDDDDDEYDEYDDSCSSSESESDDKEKQNRKDRKDSKDRRDSKDRKDHGLVTDKESRQPCDQEILCPAHVIITRKNNKARMIKNKIGKMVDESVSVRLFGTNLVKACVLRANEELKNDRLVIPKCLSGCLVVLPLLIFILFPIKNINDLSPDHTAHNARLCCTLECSAASVNKTAQMNAAQTEYETFYYTSSSTDSPSKKDELWWGFVDVLQWFMCMAIKLDDPVVKHSIRIGSMFVYLFITFNTFILFETIFNFLEMGTTIFERHFRAIRFMNTLVQQSIIVRKYDNSSTAAGVPSKQYTYSMDLNTLPVLETKSPAVCLLSPGRAKAYMYAQDMLLDIGLSYSLRLELLAGACGIAIVALTITSVVFGVVHNFDIPLYILFTYFIFFAILVYYLMRMITSAGRMNVQMETNARTMLDIEKRILYMHSNNENAPRAFKESLMLAATAIRDVRDMMVEMHIVRPIKFLGLVAGPQLFTTIGTLVFTAISSFFSRLR